MRQESGLRQDVFLDNDSRGMSVMSATVVDRVLALARTNPAELAAGHEVIPLRLEGDDSFITRIVVNQPLAAPELDQWICRVHTKLKVPCGRLLVCGGFDPRSLADFRENGPSGSVLEVRVPPGEYGVDLYTHLPSMTGRVLRDRWDEKVGAWFRREHPSLPFPSWLAGELARFPEEDPGHEKEWLKLKASVASKRLRVDTACLDWVGYLIHLQQPSVGTKLMEPERGWFATDCGFRRPARFPLGLPAVDAEDVEVRLRLGAILRRKGG